VSRSIVLSVGLDAVFTIRGIAALICLALVGIPGEVWAAESAAPATVRAHLDISAADSCATAPSVAAQVAKRSGRIEFVGAQADLPTLRGKIGRTAGAGAGVQVELVVVPPSGARSTRRLTAPDCEQGVDALALLIAMTLDPLAVLQRRSDTNSDATKMAPLAPSADPTSPSQSSPHATSAGAVPMRDDNAPLPAEPATGPSMKVPASDKQSKGDSPNLQPLVLSPGAVAVDPSEVVFVSYGLLGATLTGPAPRAMMGLGLYGLVAFDRASPLSLALRATASYYGRAGIPETGGVADFSLGVAGLDVCALRLTAGPVSSRACAAGRVGRLSASGSNTYDGQSNGRIFASVGSAALVTLALPAAFELAAGAEVGWALTRSEYAFNPNVFYRSSPLVLMFGLGIGRHH